MELNSASGEDVVSKSKFARIVGVSAPRVSQWLASGQINGDALVGRGHRARIRVAVAKEQLKRNLDPVQHLGANGRAQLDGNGAAAASTVEDSIKAERLRQLALSNAKAAAEAALRSGRYVRADDARQQLGRVAARLMAVFEASFTEFANSLAASPPATSRDALRTLRATWRTIRVRQAKVAGEEAIALPPMLDDDEAENADSERPAACA
jgi:DNA-binding transcriptional regulator YdaS (Cro superfamily)